MVADMAGKPTDPQAAMKTHLSQSTAIGAFDGQHGMSLAISSIASADISEEAISDGVISSAIACSEAGLAAIAGREAGANARPAIIRIASNRRMAKCGFTARDSHRLVAMGRSLIPVYEASVKRELIAIKPIFVQSGPTQPAIARSETVFPAGSPARASPP